MTAECYIVIAGFILSAIIAFTILLVELYGTIKYYPNTIWCNPISKFFNRTMSLTYHEIDSVWCYSDADGNFTLGARGVIVPCILPLLISIVLSVSLLNGYLTELLLTSLIMLFLYLIKRMRLYLRRYCKWNPK